MSTRNEGARAVSTLDLVCFVADYVRLAEVEEPLERELPAFPLDISGAFVALEDFLTATGRELPAHELN